MWTKLFKKILAKAVNKSREQELWVELWTKVLNKIWFVNNELWAKVELWTWVVNKRCGTRLAKWAKQGNIESYGAKSVKRSQTLSVIPSTLFFIPYPIYVPYPISLIPYIQSIIPWFLSPLPFFLSFKDYWLVAKGKGLWNGVGPLVPALVYHLKRYQTYIYIHTYIHISSS